MVRRNESNKQWLQDYREEYDRLYQPTGENMMDMTDYATTESNDLKAADFIGKNLKVRIESVEIRSYPAREGQAASDKGVLHFEGKEKTLVLNKTNTKILINAYGKDSEGWVGREIGLSTHETEMSTGWVVKPLDVKEPEYEPDILF